MNILHLKTKLLYFPPSSKSSLEKESKLNLKSLKIAFNSNLVDSSFASETHSFKKEWLFTISFPVVSCTSVLEFRLPH